MGGNAFKETNTRLDLEHYLNLQDKIVQLCNNNNIEYRLTKYLKEKKDFGDLDIIVEDTKNSLLSVLSQEFKVLNSYINGNVHSYAVEVIPNKTFQVDFIILPKDKLDSAEFYFSFNDLNNLAGKLARHLSCSFGFEGLYYTYYTNNNDNKKRFFITADSAEIYRFLDLDINKFNEGFNNLEEIYSFIEASKWFHPSIYLLENLNHRHRVRDRKRVVYSNFIEHINNNYSDVQYLKPPTNSLEIVESYFPNSNLTNRINLYQEEVLFNKLGSKVFREEVLPTIDCKKEELVNLIKYIKTKAFKQYIINLSKEGELKDFTTKCIELYKNNE